MKRFGASRHWSVAGWFITLTTAWLVVARAQEKPPSEGARQTIAITSVKRSAPVDFAQDILPILKKNCLACHNKTSAKGDLVLETPQDMLKGGESGPAIVARKGDQSLVLKLASHQKRPIMPPKDNKAAAANLTPDELGLIKLWIDQGAKAGVLAAKPVEWQPLPESLNPIFAVALTGDGQYAACARANQISVYHLGTQQLDVRLTDARLAKAYSNAPPAHNDLVQSLAFSPDGTLLASGSFREVKLWRRPANLKAFAWPAIAPQSVTASAASRDGVWLATGGDDGRVTLWNGATGKRQGAWGTSPGAVRSLGFSPDGNRLAAVAADGALGLWSIPDGKRLARTNASPALTAVVWLATDRLATGAEDGAVRSWQTTAGKTTGLVGTGTLATHPASVVLLALGDATNGQLVSGGVDGSVRVWDLAKAKLSKELAHGGALRALALRGDGQRLATAGTNGVVKLWNVEKGEVVAELTGNRYLREEAELKGRELEFQKGEVTYRQGQITQREKEQKEVAERVKKSTEAKTAADKAVTDKQPAVREAGEAKAAAERAANELEIKIKESLEALGNFEKTIPAVADKAKVGGELKALGEKLAAETKQKQKQAQEKLAAEQKKLEGLQAELKKLEQTKSNADEEARLAGEAETKAGELAEQAKAARQAADERLKQVETELEAARKATAVANAQVVSALAFSPDGRVLATGGEDQAIHTWNATTGAPFEVYNGHKGAIGTLSFVGNDRLVSGAADRGAIVWDLHPAWKLERVIGTGDANSPLADRVNALRFSPDGKWLATGGGEPTRGGELKLWEVATGKPLNDFKNVHSDAVLGLDFSPDGKFLASGAADKFLRVTEIATGKVVKSFEGHTHHVLAVSWKRDGRTLVTAGADNVVKVWDFVTGERKKNIDGFNKEVTSISFIGFTDQAVASSGDNQVKLFRDTGEAVRSLPGAVDFMNAAGVTRDGRVVVAGGQDSVLRVWNATDGKVLTTFGPDAK